MKKMISTTISLLLTVIVFSQQSTTEFINQLRTAIVKQQDFTLDIPKGEVKERQETNPLSALSVDTEMDLFFEIKKWYKVSDVHLGWKWNSDCYFPMTGTSIYSIEFMDGSKVSAVLYLQEYKISVIYCPVIEERDMSPELTFSAYSGYQRHLAIPEAHLPYVFAEIPLLPDGWYVVFFLTKSSEIRHYEFEIKNSAVRQVVIIDGIDLVGPDPQFTLSLRD